MQEKVMLILIKKDGVKPSFVFQASLICIAVFYFEYGFFYFASALVKGRGVRFAGHKQCPIALLHGEKGYVSVKKLYVVVTVVVAGV